MADNLSPVARRRNMACVRNKNTSPELLVQGFLHAHGIGYLLHDTTLPGTPDIILPRYRTVIFVHGCFWHGHEGCRRFTLPQTRAEFWNKKIGRNVAHDLRQQTELMALGWNVLVVWSCELRSSVREHTLAALLPALTEAPESTWFEF